MTSPKITQFLRLQTHLLGKTHLIIASPLEVRRRKARSLQPGLQVGSKKLVTPSWTRHEQLSLTSPETYVELLCFPYHPHPLRAPAKTYPSLEELEERTRDTWRSSTCVISLMHLRSPASPFVALGTGSTSPQAASSFYVVDSNGDRTRLRACTFPRSILVHGTPALGSHTARKRRVPGFEVRGSWQIVALQGASKNETRV